MISRFIAIASPLLLLFTITACAQDTSQNICKGAKVPDGFVVSGETVSDSCRDGSAWIIKPSR